MTTPFDCEMRNDNDDGGAVVGWPSWLSYNTTESITLPDKDIVNDSNSGRQSCLVGRHGNIDMLPAEVIFIRMRKIAFPAMQ